MAPTREPLKLPVDCSPEEYKRASDFVTKVKEIDRRIFIKFSNAMTLYQSGSLNNVDLKNRVSTIFQNHNDLLDGFNQIITNSKTDSNVSKQDHVVFDESKVKQLREFIKKLSRERDGLLQGFLDSVGRFKNHEDVKKFKEEVDMILRKYPCLKKELEMIMIDNDLRVEITFEEEDEMFEDDMYFRGIESAIKFAEEAEDDKKPPVAVYGAIRRFYKIRHKKLPEDSMKNPKLAVRRILPSLKRKHKELLERKKSRFEEMKKLKLISDVSVFES